LVYWARMENFGLDGAAPAPLLAGAAPVPLPF